LQVFFQSFSGKTEENTLYFQSKELSRLLFDRTVNQNEIRADPFDGRPGENQVVFPTQQTEDPGPTVYNNISNRTGFRIDLQVSDETVSGAV
jgi:hypothetical protein